MDGTSSIGEVGVEMRDGRFCMLHDGIVHIGLHVLPNRSPPVRLGVAFEVATGLLP